MTDRPTRVRIGPLWFKVNWRDQAWSDETGLGGNCCCKEQTLDICDAYSPELSASLFVHEVIHGILYTALPNHTKINDEWVANLVGFHLTAFWQDNPEAFLWYADCLGPRQ